MGSAARAASSRDLELHFCPSDFRGSIRKNPTARQLAGHELSIVQVRHHDPENTKSEYIQDNVQQSYANLSAKDRNKETE
jgi:hypothetical protein